jgi:hypothetical protein
MPKNEKHFFHASYHSRIHTFRVRIPRLDALAVVYACSRRFGLALADIGQP